MSTATDGASFNNEPLVSIAPRAVRLTRHNAERNDPLEWASEDSGQSEPATMHRRTGCSWRARYASTRSAVAASGCGASPRPVSWNSSRSRSEKGPDRTDARGVVDEAGSPTRLAESRPGERSIVMT